MHEYTVCPKVSFLLSFNREKFSENLQMVEDIISSFGDEGSQLEKSQEYTGFQKFLFTSLETLDIDISDYIGIL